MIRSLEHRFDVSELRAQLGETSIWDEFPYRTNLKSPHRECSDIWVRYNPMENFGPGFNDEHESHWYPVADKIPAAKRLCEEMLEAQGSKEFGGVLITKIPPGKQVYPHSDHGWHAEHYEKYAILIEGNTEQSFCFDGMEHRCEPGESFTFNNQHRHWVLNPSDMARVTLIICARTH